CCIFFSSHFSFFSCYGAHPALHSFPTRRSSDLQPRIFMAMARDGLLPGYFAKIHPRFRTPHITTIWTGVAVGGVAMLTDIGSLADLTNIGTLFAFVLVCLGVIVLRRTNRERPRPFRVPFVPVFPLLGVVFCFALMLSLPL